MASTVRISLQYIMVLSFFDLDKRFGEGVIGEMMEHRSV